MSVSKRLPLALSSLNNSPSSAAESNWLGEAARLPNRPRTDDRTGFTNEPASTHQQLASVQPIHQQQAKQKPHTPVRKLLASPRTAKLFTSKAQELAKRLPRSWEDPLAHAKPHTNDALQPPHAQENLPIGHQRASRSEHSSPRSPKLAELWNLDFNPKQQRIREKVCR